MAAFEKGHKKYGGRAKGVANRATTDLKKVIDRLLPDDELDRQWKKRLFSKDQATADHFFELAMYFRFGRPKQTDQDPETAPAIKIDISSIPRHLEEA